MATDQQTSTCPDDSAGGIESKSLWFDRNRARFFLVPDDEKLPPGDFVLRTLTGRELHVDAASLAPFERSEQQARSWAKAEFGKLLDSIRSAADNFVEKLRKRTEELD